MEDFLRSLRIFWPIIACWGILVLDLALLFLLTHVVGAAWGVLPALFFFGVVIIAAVTLAPGRFEWKGWEVIHFELAVSKFWQLVFWLSPIGLLIFLPYLYIRRHNRPQRPFPPV